jgi:hypothetical protein
MILRVKEGSGEKMQIDRIIVIWLARRGEEELDEGRCRGPNRATRRAPANPVGSRMMMERT